MEPIIISPRDDAERNFFLELAKRIGAKVTSLEDINDVELLKVMQENKNMPMADKNDMLHTIKSILNEDLEEYK